MEILNGGAFVNLDSREKIEQLAFTAREIARTAVGTDGFVNAEATNGQIAHEIWQGAEYMTREHEAAQIKNIFVGNFLDELRGLKTAGSTDGETASAAESATDAATIVEIGESVAPTNSVAENDNRDEFLGFVEPEATVGDDEVRQTKAVPTSPAATDDAMSDFQIVSPAAVSVYSEDAPNDSPSETIDEASLAFNQNGETQQAEAGDGGNAPPVIAVEKAKIEAFALPEKEPYQFDRCTITATIQILPAAPDAPHRKAILSVRTHDFAPQISVAEIGKDASAAELLPALERAFNSYRSDLPVKVMDKMKREKQGAKRQPAASKTTAAITATNAPKNAPAAPDSKAIAPAASAKTSATAKPATVSDSEKSGSAETKAAAPSAPVASPKSVSTKTSRADDLQPSLFGF